ncbi:MAG: methyltransferase domain-containing protein [Cyclobacteriaceae bacterium]|nr:methyltransferase domain-containing protein [Cyclobacteriaceae bacterium]
MILNVIENKFRLRLPLPPKFRWWLSHKSEIDFWDNYFKNGGLHWKANYELKFDPQLRLQDELASLLPKNRQEVKILDVGAGPLTYVGKVHQNLNISIEAVDPLAVYYDKLLNKYNITPLVRTKSGSAEQLSLLFPANSFDLVFARNCIDHSYNPEKAILEMLTTVKVGCYVLLAHIPNEGENEGYHGLHQWNFNVRNGDFIISSKTGEVNFTKKYSSGCVVACSILTKDNVDWLYTSILKLS